MNTWSSYPKIWNFGHPQAKDLLLDDVVVQEKVDGSQFSFGVIDGVLRVRSKGAEIVVDAPPAMFKRAVETVKRLEPTLLPGCTYRGEVLDKPKHNALAYDRTPKDHIILFDITVGHEEYAAHFDVMAEGQRLGLEVVPTLFFGKITSPEFLRSFLDTTSVLGGQKIEGVVVKNYHRHGIDGKQMMGKFVSEAFKEIHSNEWKKENPSQGDVLATLIDAFRSPARWQKAVVHMEEQGKLTYSPKDIGPLIHEVQKDTLEEGREEIIEALLKWVLPHVKRTCVAGLPEWYKQRLLERQFEQEAPNVDA